MTASEFERVVLGPATVVDIDRTWILGVRPKAAVAIRIKLDNGPSNPALGGAAQAHFAKRNGRQPLLEAAMTR